MLVPVRVTFCAEVADELEMVTANPLPAPLQPEVKPLQIAVTLFSVMAPLELADNPNIWLLSNTLVPVRVMPFEVVLVLFTKDTPLPAALKSAVMLLAVMVPSV